MARYTNKVMPSVYSALKDQNNECIPDLLNAHEKHVEAPLKQLNSPFFGGQSLNAMDIHIWPFLEVMDAKASVGDITIPATRFPTMISYIERMKEVPAVKEVMHTLDDFKGFWETWKTPGPPDYNYHSKYPFYTADEEIL
ncbi:glutathione S-transferase omega-1-like [Corticium candelabrum]|uniref:glutathione S-transferase omega-1-like n=1 Tax=Corticium candelabrum TaxID=121492 RepID=UPI002E26F23A|nr:glutathione S-transferase omega-1-like [Corticium candelabrum]